MRAEQVILGSILSEKAVCLSESKMYTLKVCLEATKDDIRAALKTVFNVDVVGISTNITRGGEARRGRTKKKSGGSVLVKKPNVKKATVRLRDGQSLPTVSLGDAASV